MIKVNAIGDACPIPVIKTKKAIAQAEGKGTIEVLVDNEIAVQNVTKMATSEGGNVTSEKIAEKEYKITIELSGEVKDCEDCAEEKLVVVISSDRMGSGNDELGKVLIKGFIFAVTQLEKLPKTIQRIYVLFIVMISFIIFNAESLGKAIYNIGGLFGANGEQLINNYTIYYLKSYLISQIHLHNLLL